MRSTNDSSEYICIVVGQSGVGKSNFINSITCTDKCSTSSGLTSSTRMYNCISRYMIIFFTILLILLDLMIVKVKCITSIKDAEILKTLIHRKIF